MNEYKFTRDDFSKAVLNTDLSALEQYKLARNQRLKEQSILNNCVNDINILKENMQEIKNLLLKMGEK